MTFIPLLFKGFLTGGSLIVAIGAQNAFVLKQGLLRQRLLLTALLCSLIDAVLIALGVRGFGHIIASYPAILYLSKWGAILFLFTYGALAFRSAFTPKRLDSDSRKSEFLTRKQTIFLLLALSLLNPHVYLDTVILLGSIAAQYTASEQIYFATGAVAASFTWFFSLTYGAIVLRPFFQKKHSWKLMDCAIGCIMWAIALSLLL